MQLRHMIQKLQSILAEHGNIDVVVPHPNVDQQSTVGTPLFHLDVVTLPRLDHFVLAGVGSQNGLRPWIAESPAPMTFVRVSPYSMQRVQGLHDMQNNSMPVTPLANEPPPSPESSPGANASATVEDSKHQAANPPPTVTNHGNKKLSRKQRKKKAG